jgi:hypothetical protein
MRGRTSVERGHSPTVMIYIYIHPIALNHRLPRSYSDDDDVVVPLRARYDA